MDKPQLKTYLIRLTLEELEELIHLTSYTSCDGNMSSRLFDRLNRIKEVKPVKNKYKDFKSNALFCLAYFIVALVITITFLGALT